MRVLLVDDHDALRVALRELLGKDPEVEVVGEGANGRDALTLVAETRPDLVLMDVSMPVMDGVEATERILALDPDVRVVALTSFREAASVSGMIAAGARGYLLKTAPAAELLEALRAAVEGRPVLAPEVLESVLTDLGRLYREQRARAEGLASVDRMKRQFISLVSDELRNPLAAITGHTRTLRHGWERLDDAVKRESLDAIDQQAGRLARRVEQILTISGLHGGEQGAAAVRFDLDAAAREALDRVAALAGERVECDLRRVIVRADRSALVAVAITLLENALEHTSGRVWLRCGSDGAESASLAVIDEGPGMTPERLEAVLSDPFTPADSSDTRAGRGLGLSLYIARQILAASGGRLEVATGPDRGSMFAAVVPRA